MVFSYRANHPIELLRNPLSKNLFKIYDQDALFAKTLYNSQKQVLTQKKLKVQVNIASIF